MKKQQNGRRMCSWRGCFHGASGTVKFMFYAEEGAEPVSIGIKYLPLCSTHQKTDRPLNLIDPDALARLAAHAQTSVHLEIAIERTRVEPIEFDDPMIKALNWGALQ